MTIYSINKRRSNDFSDGPWRRERPKKTQMHFRLIVKDKIKYDHYIKQHLVDQTN